MTIKTKWVESPFMEYGYWSTDQVEVGSKTVKVEKGIFSKRFVEEQIPIYEEQKVWHSEGYSDKEMDGEKFTKRIEKAISDLEKEGFEVIHIIPLISGRYKNDYSSSPNMSFGVSAQLSSEALLGLIDWEVPGHKIREIILRSTGW